MRVARLCHLREMDNILCWNVRGMNAPNKQREVRLLCNKESTGLVALLKTKIKVDKVSQMANSMFGDWGHITNYEKHYNGKKNVVLETELL